MTTFVQTQALPHAATVPVMAKPEAVAPGATTSTDKDFWYDEYPLPEWEVGVQNTEELEVELELVPNPQVDEGEPQVETEEPLLEPIQEEPIIPVEDPPPRYPHSGGQQGQGPKLRREEMWHPELS